MRGGYHQISYNSGTALQWSSGWESVYKTLLNSNFGDNSSLITSSSSPTSPTLDDSQWFKRLKVKLYYEKYLFNFDVYRTTLPQPSLKEFPTPVRCVCGHIHAYSTPCVTCDSYKQTSATIISKSEGSVKWMIQCVACLSWQHTQCLIEEGFYGRDELSSLLDNPEFHYYCDMCLNQPSPIPWNEVFLFITDQRKQLKFDF